jgi:hypothetical protein
MRRRLLLDTNLLILFVVGLTDVRMIARHRRLRIYDPIDFAYVSDLVAISDGLASCPNVLTEASNLIGQIAEPDKSRILSRYRALFGEIDEGFVPSSTAAQRPEFERLGLADAVLLFMASEGGALLTDDLPLYLAAANSGVEAINYNHIRRNRPDYT